MDPSSASDLLSAVVRNVKLEASTYFRAELQGDFGLSMPSIERRIRFHLCLRGEMCLVLPDSETPTRVRAGDVFLVTGGSAHLLQDRPGRPVTPMEQAKRQVGYRSGTTFRWGSGPPGVTLICGEFGFRDEILHPLLRSLPPMVMGSTTDNEGFAAIQRLLEFIDMETLDQLPGALAVVDRVSEVVMIHVLRAWLAQDRISMGALRAMEDPRIKTALDAMHAQFHLAWTVGGLASRAGMSRTSFSTTFTELLGVSPMRYLKSWRMDMARSMLQQGQLTIPEIAQRVGYKRQASFTKAFRETIGTPPAAYRTRIQAGMSQPGPPA